MCLASHDPRTHLTSSGRSGFRRIRFLGETGASETFRRQKLPQGKIGNRGAAVGASGEGGGEEMYKDGWGSRARSVDARQSPGRDAGRSSSFIDSIVYL